MATTAMRKKRPEVNYNAHDGYRGHNGYHGCDSSGE